MKGYDKKMMRKNPILTSILTVLTFTIICGCSMAPEWKKERLFADKCMNYGLWREAVLRYQRVLDHEPENIAVLNNLAVAYEAIGEFGKAQETYETALRIDPENKKIKRNFEAMLAIKPSSDGSADDEETDE